jgi:CHAT domain-containing protein
VWAVGDAATAKLIGRYHELLAEGKAPSDALREAQLEMLLAARHAYEADPNAAAAGHAHPYFWAPFLLLGQW